MTNCEIIKHNEKYNIIAIQRGEMIEYYLERVGYGDLAFLFGCAAWNYNDAYIDEYIAVVEKSGFWEDGEQ